jgi:hypothetical protein
LSTGDDAILGGLLDSNRIGISDFSFGGYTTLKALELDSRFRAGLAMAPGPLSATYFPGPLQLSRPLMFIQGELDNNSLFAQTSAYYSRILAEAPDRWFVAIHGAGHFPFMNECFMGVGGFPPCDAVPSQVKVATIVHRWATAFLMTYVALDDSYSQFLDPAREPVAEGYAVRTRSGTPPVPLPTVLPFVPRSQGRTMLVAPAAPRGSILLTDDLRGPDRGTLQSSNSESAEFAVRHTPDGYLISVDSLSERRSARDQSQVVLRGDYADSTVVVDVALVNPADDQFILIACRSQSQFAQYRLTVYPNRGQFGIAQWVNGASTALVPLQTSTAIQPGSETNRLAWTCRGTVLEATLNGRTVASVSTGVFSQGQTWFGIGQAVGLEGSTTPAGQAIEALFSDLTVIQE